MNPKLLKERIRTSAQRPDIVVAFENLMRSPVVRRQEARAVGSSPRPAARAAVSGGVR